VNPKAWKDSVEIIKAYFKSLGRVGLNVEVNRLEEDLFIVSKEEYTCLLVVESVLGDDYIKNI
jgi:hypothetical protein